MKGTNVLREKINTLEGNLEGQKFEDVLEKFIKELYEPKLNIDSVENMKVDGIKGESYSIRAIKPKDKNFKNFIAINEKLVYKYSNNIKKNYDNKLLDAENEYSNIYLYIVESLYYFYVNHCNCDSILFKLYIENSNKTYVNSEDKKYTFAKYMFMSLDRRIKEENKLHEKSIEKGNMNANGRFSKIELDATSIDEEGKEVDIDLYSIGGYKELGDEDIRTYEETLEDNIKEMIRVQDKLSTILTNAQVEFIVNETYGCYYDIEIDDFVIKEYTKQQRNQYFNQISKRTGTDVKSFFVKTCKGKYVDDMISYRKKNKKVLEVEPKNQNEEYINQHSNFFVSNIKINN